MLPITFFPCPAMVLDAASCRELPSWFWKMLFTNTIDRRWCLFVENIKWIISWTHHLIKKNATFSHSSDFNFVNFINPTVTSFRVGLRSGDIKSGIGSACLKWSSFNLFSFIFHCILLTFHVRFVFFLVFLRHLGRQKVRKQKNTACILPV